jgi:membrane protease YdiL (CAAX protease family)
MIKNVLQPNRADTNTSAPSKRSPLAFFVLIFALSIPLWVIGSFVEVDGLPKNAQVTEFGLAFTPLAAASILVYGEEGLAGVGRLFKRIFDYRRITRKVWYVPILFLMPFMYLLSYGGVRLLGISLPVQPHLPLLLVPLLSVVFFVGAAGGELGYMGYAVDPMQECWGALTAGIIMGSVWAVWHVPALIQSNQAPAYIAWGFSQELVRGS